MPDEYRCGKALGPVESIQEHPRDAGRLLIGYSRGLVALWDQSTRAVQHLFLGNQVPGPGRPWGGGAAACPPRVSSPSLSPLQQLESLAWEHSGKSIVSSHSDGGYMVWAAGGGGQRTQQPVLSTIPYGAWALGGVGGRPGCLGRCRNSGVVFLAGPFPCKAINKILWRTCESG